MEIQEKETTNQTELLDLIEDVEQSLSENLQDFFIQSIVSTILVYILSHKVFDLFELPQTNKIRSLVPRVFSVFTFASVMSSMLPTLYSIITFCALVLLVYPQQRDLLVLCLEVCENLWASIAKRRPFLSMLSTTREKARGTFGLLLKFLYWLDKQALLFGFNKKLVATLITFSIFTTTKFSLYFIISVVVTTILLYGWVIFCLLPIRLYPILFLCTDQEAMDMFKQKLNYFLLQQQQLEPFRNFNINLAVPEEFRPIASTLFFHYVATIPRYSLAFFMTFLISAIKTYSIWESLFGICFVLVSLKIHTAEDEIQPKLFIYCIAGYAFGTWALYKWSYLFFFFMVLIGIIILVLVETEAQNSIANDLVELIPDLEPKISPFLLNKRSHPPQLRRQISHSMIASRYAHLEVLVFGVLNRLGFSSTIHISGIQRDEQSVSATNKKTIVVLVSAIYGVDWLGHHFSSSGYLQFFFLLALIMLMAYFAILLHFKSLNRKNISKTNQQIFSVQKSYHFAFAMMFYPTASIIIKDLKLRLKETVHQLGSPGEWKTILQSNLITRLRRSNQIAFIAKLTQKILAILFLSRLILSYPLFMTMSALPLGLLFLPTLYEKDEDLGIFKTALSLFVDLSSLDILKGTIISTLFLHIIVESLFFGTFLYLPCTFMRSLAVPRFLFSVAKGILLFSILVVYSLLFIIICSPSSNRVYVLERICAMLHKAGIAGTYRVVVNRQTAGSEFFQTIMNTEPEQLTLQSTIVFSGEQGIDGGGLLSEVIKLTAEYLLDPNQNHSVVENKGGSTCTLQTNKSNSYSAQIAFGRFLGYCMVKRKVPAINLTPACLRAMLQKQLVITIDEFLSYDPELCKQLHKLSAHSEEEINGIVFWEKRLLHALELAVNNRIPETLSVEHELPLEKQHLDKFIVAKAIESMIFDRLICAEKVLEGLTQVIPWVLLKRYSADDVGKLLGGAQCLRVSDWKIHSRYEGLSDTDELSVHFWEILERWEREEVPFVNVDGTSESMVLKLFQAITGDKCIPIGGFSVLSPPFKLVLSGHGDERFPVAHTCFNSIDIPRYSDKSRLEERLIDFISNAPAGFFQS